jgi:hypothetical protein
MISDNRTINHPVPNHNLSPPQQQQPWPTHGLHVTRTFYFSTAPSSIFDHKPRNKPKTFAFSNQLKKLYRDIHPHSFVIAYCKLSSLLHRIAFSLMPFPFLMIIAPCLRPSLDLRHKTTANTITFPSATTSPA